MPGSDFSLDKINIGGSDFVSIFVNTAKFTIHSVIKESQRVLQYRRQTKLAFFDENRAVFLLAQSKTSGNKILLASFHAKKNKVTDIKREGLIIDFFTYLEDLAKMVGTRNILVGTDINHQMKKFEARTKNRTFCVEVFHYEFHEMCKRKGKHVIDFFLHSPRVIPEEDKPCIFHEDTDILDHHPIHSVFLFTEGGSISEPEAVSAPGPSPPPLAPATKVPSLQGPAKRNPSSRLKSLVPEYASPQDPYQAMGLVVQQDSFNSSGPNSKELQPSFLQTGPHTTHDNNVKKLLQPQAFLQTHNQTYHTQNKPQMQNQHQMQTHNQSHQNQHQMHQQYNTQNQHQIQNQSKIQNQNKIHQQDHTRFSFLGVGHEYQHNLPDLQNIQTEQGGPGEMAEVRKFGAERGTEGEEGTAVKSPLGAVAVPARPLGLVGAGQGAGAGDHMGKPKSSLMFTGNGRNFSTDGAVTQERASFACELCKRSFETQNGLFIHFGKMKESHHPCKQKFEDETNIDKKFCLRVFRTEAGMKQHRTKQGGNPRHHHPGKPFPNLNIA